VELSSYASIRFHGSHKDSINLGVSGRRIGTVSCVTELEYRGGIEEWEWPQFEPKFLFFFGGGGGFGNICRNGTFANVKVITRYTQFLSVHNLDTHSHASINDGDTF